MILTFSLGIQTESRHWPASKNLKIIHQPKIEMYQNLKISTFLKSF